MKKFLVLLIKRGTRDVRYLSFSRTFFFCQDFYQQRARELFLIIKITLNGHANIHRRFILRILVWSRQLERKAKREWDRYIDFPVRVGVSTLFKSCHACWKSISISLCRRSSRIPLKKKKKREVVIVINSHVLFRNT